MSGQLLGILLIIVIIAFAAFFIQSGQSGVLRFGRINFGVPLTSLGENPILRYDFSKNPGNKLSQDKDADLSPSRKPLGGLEIVDNKPPVSLPPGSPSPRFSEFYGRVKIGSARQNTISLKAAFSSGEKIDITGWYLKGNRGGWYVPKAINVYDPTGLAEPGNILLGRGETVNMYSSVSPVGVNFRLNLCTGYLGNTIKFNPSLPRQCPGADKATLRNFSSRCQDFVPSAVSSCRQPPDNPPLGYFDDDCRDYLKRFTFRGCFDTYRAEPGFLKPEWRVWMGSAFLDSRHDRLFLLDANRFVVDWREW